LSAGPVAAAVLAAGRGARLGGDAAKPLVEWQGRPLVRWAVDAAVASGLAPVVVVVGYRAEDVRAALVPGTSRSSPSPASPDSEVLGSGDPNRGLLLVDNHEWEEGIASSLRAALRALTPLAEVEAVCVGLADQPRVGSEAYRRLAAHQGTNPITEARYDGQPGNPVKLARSLWPQAMELRGDVGARALMRGAVVDLVECGDTGSAADVDTPEDLERLLGPEETP
jgi:CTP:molybdopterin cytidylyltransferase MocA